MLTVANLLVMGMCASCERELVSTWMFCLYCGRPLVLASEVDPKLGAEPVPVPVVGLESDLVPEAIPAAIRIEQDVPPRRRHNGPFWVGVSVGILGLALIIYAAVLVIGSQA